MKRNIRAFTLAVILIGLTILTAALSNLNYDSSILAILFFVMLSTISESLTVATSDDSAVSVGFAVSLAIIILFSPVEASAIIFAGSFLQLDSSEGVIKHVFNTSSYKRMFNSSAYMIGVFVTTLIYHSLDKLDWSLNIGEIPIIPIIIAVAVYFIMHMIIYIPLFSMLHEKSIKEAFKENFWVSRHLVALAPFGILISFAFITYGWFMVILIFGPLMTARILFIQYMEAKRTYFETVETLSSALDAKDEYTNGHSKRVSEYACGIAEEMGMGKYQKDLILNSALLHDIGKIGIRDEILKKTGNLTLGEVFEIKRHPEIGEKIIGNIHYLRDVSKIIRHHHERYDGNGYPDSLKCDSIPIEACVLTVADAFDAMTSNRPYRKAMEVITAINIILDESGKQFHPAVVIAFEKHINNRETEVTRIDEEIQ